MRIPGEYFGGTPNSGGMDKSQGKIRGKNPTTWHPQGSASELFGRRVAGGVFQAREDTHSCSQGEHGTLDDLK